MLKISAEVAEVVRNNTFLEYGLHHKLLNLSQVASFIRPLVEARVKKEVSNSAVLMSLSRLQQLFQKQQPQNEGFYVDHITIRGNLCSFAYERTKKVHRTIDRVYNQIQQRGGSMVVNEGMSTINIIVDADSVPVVAEGIPEKPKNVKTNLASLGVQFDEKFEYLPGCLDGLMQQMSLQHIDVCEISSTYTEFVFYLNEKDIPLAFDTISGRFLKKQAFAQAVT